MWAIISIDNINALILTSDEWYVEHNPTLLFFLAVCVDNICVILHGGALIVYIVLSTKQPAQLGSIAEILRDNNFSFD